jgi:hypothetical protein
MAKLDRARIPKLGPEFAHPGPAYKSGVPLKFFFLSPVFPTTSQKNHKIQNPPSVLANKKPRDIARGFVGVVRQAQWMPNR